jgi:hypothetical protein
LEPTGQAVVDFPPVVEQAPVSYVALVRLGKLDELLAERAKLDLLAADPALQALWLLAAPAVAEGCGQRESRERCAE